ncbi:MAG: hypothetical protein L6Q80_13420, partial [Dehalococcoidia bacterium]|nr:hypothetical protein [Dehalococcoidia bacterium]
HLKLAVRVGPATWPGIAFRQVNAPLADRIDIVYSLSRDRGSERIELEVLDIAPAAERRPLELE